MREGKVKSGFAGEITLEVVAGHLESDFYKQWYMGCDLTTPAGRDQFFLAI
jgi:hypothetical protein